MPHHLYDNLNDSCRITAIIATFVFHTKWYYLAPCNAPPHPFSATVSPQKTVER